ncbi:MAG: hypothetical protein EOO61_16400 [Hymenobacter sp.]|nr:MAG: hypothetical protein EOO61_16400 [Hymenobacter sp.]
MSIRKEVRELIHLGPMPDEKQDIADGVIEQYEEAIHAISRPVTRNEAEELVMLFPPNGCFGLDWTLLHLIETTPGWPVISIIEKCPSVEWKQRMLDRVANM